MHHAKPFLIVCGLLFLFSSTPAALAQMEMPPRLADELGEYPDAKVTGYMTLGGSSNVQLDCGQAAPGEVFAFYRTRLADKGYTTEMELAGADAMTLAVRKAGVVVLVHVSAKDGATTAALTLIEP